jgi:hypothetical protein
MLGIIALVLGAVLGMRLNVVSLGSAIAVALISMFVAGKPFSEMGLVSLGLQVGYLAGAMARFGAVPFSSEVLRQRLRHAVTGYRAH